ncbi:MAG: AsmA family protein [Hyphomicrobiales bacterium]
MQRMHVWAGLAMAALVILLGGWMILSPGWVTARLQEAVRAQMSRDIEVEGGAHLELSPLAVRLDRVRLFDSDTPDDAFVTAREVRIPITLAGLLSRHIELTQATLVAPEFAFLVSERGEANWALPAPKTPQDIKLEMQDAKIRFFDTRNDQGFALSGGTLTADLAADGGIALSGTVVLHDRLAKVDASLKSLERVHEDGSPFDLSLSAPDLDVSLEGRLATAKTLSLAGTASASGKALYPALAWIGIRTGREGGPRFSVTGALETAGRAFAAKKSEIVFGEDVLSGDISFDFRDEIPVLEAVLTGDSLDLSTFVPDTGIGADDWGRNPLGLGALRVLDAKLAITANSLHYSGITAGPSQVAVTLDKGKFDGQINMSDLAGGQASLQVSADATVTPPSISLGFASSGADLETVLTPLGLGLITGLGDISLQVSGQGTTQQELIGTLKGEASLSAADGLLRGIEIPALFAAASQKIVDGWSGAAGASTMFSSLAARATISDGIAALADLTLTSPTLSLTGRGDVDLLRRAVNLRVDPRIVSGVNGTSAGLPVSLVVAGPWTTPRIYPDIPDILTKPAQGFESLRAMGLQQLTPAPVAPAN